MMVVYVASALGFTEAGRLFLTSRLLPMIERCGHTVRDPWTTLQQGDGFGGLKGDAVDIASRNVAAINECDALVAILDGVDVDSGTASEIGYAFAKGKQIIGYRNDFRAAGESAKLVVNLQVEFFIRASGGRIVRTLDALEGELTR